LISLALFLLLASPGAAWAAKGVSAARAVPAEIYTAEAAVVTVTAAVASDPDSPPVSINLMRVNERGKAVKSLGRLYDDGTHGDAVTGDGTHTGQFSFNEPNSVDIRLVVTVAHRGTLLRTRSQPFTVAVRRRSSGAHRRQPTLQERRDGTRTAGAMRGRFEVNAPGLAVTADTRRSRAAERVATRLKPFAPVLSVGREDC
jgi:hypothetical protein